MLGECGKGEKAEDLGSAGLKSVCRIRRGAVERPLRFLRRYQRSNAMAARGTQTPMGMPTSRPMLDCSVVGKVLGGSATLPVAELEIVLWLPSDVIVCVTNLMLGLLEPAVDRLLLEVTFVGIMLVENV